jgi:hypothetical protein
MQRASAIPTIGVELLDWSIAPKVRVIPAQANGLGFVSEKDTRAERPDPSASSQGNSSSFPPSKSVPPLDPGRWPGLV